MSLKEQIKTDLKNPWLKGIIATVAITVAVNVVFIAYAFIKPPNLVVKDYYEKGKAYFHEEHIREEAARHAWRLQLLAPDHPVVNQPHIYRLYVMDHQGQPVRSGDVTLFAYRPSDASKDFKVNMPYVDAGTFSKRIVFPLPGNWDIIAQVKSGEHQFDVAQRVFVAR